MVAEFEGLVKGPESENLIEELEFKGLVKRGGLTIKMKVCWRNM